MQIQLQLCFRNIYDYLLAQMMDYSDSAARSMASTRGWICALCQLTSVDYAGSLDNNNNNNNYNRSRQRQSGLSAVGKRLRLWQSVWQWQWQLVWQFIKPATRLDREMTSFAYCMPPAA